MDALPLTLSQQVAKRLVSVEALGDVDVTGKRRARVTVVELELRPHLPLPPSPLPLSLPHQTSSHFLTVRRGKHHMVDIWGGGGEGRLNTTW